jgi:sugar phosphate isomerase/epimerase
MTLGRNDLVLCSGTLPRETTFAERLEAAVAGGFSAISLWGRDYDAARCEGVTDTDIPVMLADHGLAVAELDPAWWWLPGADRAIDPALDSEDVFRFGEAQLFALADLVSARSLNAVDVFGGAWDVDAAAEAFAGLCDRAAEHGLLVHLEFLPWSKIPDVVTARDIAQTAGRANGGIAVDAWHLFRSGGKPDALSGVPGSMLLGVQLDDGPTEAEANLVHATLHERRLPGEGDFDLAGLLRALIEAGSDAPIGVEVFSDALQSLGPIEAARQAGAATRELLDDVAGVER